MPPPHSAAAAVTAASAVNITAGSAANQTSLAAASQSTTGVKVLDTTGGREVTSMLSGAAMSTGGGVGVWAWLLVVAVLPHVLAVFVAV
jgi:hypothetical protein